MAHEIAPTYKVTYGQVLPAVTVTKVEGNIGVLAALSDGGYAFANGSSLVDSDKHEKKKEAKKGKKRKQEKRKAKRKEEKKIKSQAFKRLKESAEDERAASATADEAKKNEAMKKKKKAMEAIGQLRRAERLKASEGMKNQRPITQRTAERLAIGMMKRLNKQIQTAVKGVDLGLRDRRRKRRKKSQSLVRLSANPSNALIEIDSNIIILPRPNHTEQYEMVALVELPKSEPADLDNRTGISTESGGNEGELF